MKCPKCGADGVNLEIEEEFTVRGKAAGIKCTACSYRTGLLYDERFTGKQVNSVIEVIKEVPVEVIPKHAVVFSAENFDTISQFHKEVGEQEDLQDAIASFIFALINGNVKYKF